MTLAQALELARQRKELTRRRKIFLICGFEPLHLAAFLRGKFAARFEDEAADLETGLFGDILGSLAAAAKSEADAAAVAIEWSDLDARLSLRASGGWGPSLQADILANCRERWKDFATELEALSSRMPVAVSLPTVPMTLFGHTAVGQYSAAEAALDQQSAAFAAQLAQVPNVFLVHPGRLSRISPPAARLDASLAVAAGFPYSIAHASALAGMFIDLLYPRIPMKGLITDLDETLWAGIVGEAGVANVQWSLTGHAQWHGLYQQQLRQLSEMGVLLAVASKNDAAIASAALARKDMYIPGAAFFPVCANWGPKSRSVAEILQAWNIGPEAVVFVDDSPMEIEEVGAAFPAMTCLAFPSGGAAKTLAFLVQLRDLFGKPAVRAEDALRPSSVRINATLRESAGSSDAGFVKSLRGKVVFDDRKDSANGRVLELINKTNQFNLNGLRVSSGEWLRHLDGAATFVTSVSYEDKFGPLGLIAVAAGTQQGRRLLVSSWVMSCRAFSRRIEFHTLDHLFRHCGAGEISLAFEATERNQPIRDFLTAAGFDADLVLTKEAFLNAGHDLPHSIGGFE